MMIPPIDLEKLTFEWDSQATGWLHGDGRSQSPGDLADYFEFLEEAAPAEEAQLRLSQHTPDSVFSLEETALSRSFSEKSNRVTEHPTNRT